VKELLTIEQHENDESLHHHQSSHTAKIQTLLEKEIRVWVLSMTSNFRTNDDGMKMVFDYFADVQEDPLSRQSSSPSSSQQECDSMMPWQKQPSN
jgi:hypothetical protein